MSSVRPHPHPGVFIVVEGVDGCGSTTHSRLLTKALKASGRETVLTCEPTAGPVGGLIRQILQRRLFVADAAGPRGFAWSTMALLFAADRLDHLDSLVLPALRDGAVVVSDRYDLSSLAYQSATAPEAHEAIPWIRELNSRALRPDVTVVIDVPAEVAEERRRGRGGVEEMFEHRALQERLVAIYARAETLVPGDRLVHVSGLGTQEEVGGRLLEAVLEAVPVLRK
ncbi:MAG TPA: dTMP kinase [Polyangiaceae bacterium]|nr:dTMP kinase [Polyangiaceae bacterium]